MPASVSVLVDLVLMTSSRWWGALARKDAKREQISTAPGAQGCQIAECRGGRSKVERARGMRAKVERAGTGGGPQWTRTASRQSCEAGPPKECKGLQRILIVRQIVRRQAPQIHKRIGRPIPKTQRCRDCKGLHKKYKTRVFLSWVFGEGLA